MTKPVGESKQPFLGLYITKELQTAVRKIAKKRGVTVSYFVRTEIERVIQQEQA